MWQSDGTYPRGTAYLMLTADKARSSRVLLYPQVESVAAGLINIEIVKQDSLTNRQDVMFYFTGAVSVTGLETLQFLARRDRGPSHLVRRNAHGQRAR